MKPEIPSGLWAVASDLTCAADFHPWQQSAAPATAVSLRRWSCSSGEALESARMAVDAFPFVALHGSADLAQAAGAQAVIAGVRSLSLDDYRRHFPDLLLGASTHDREEAMAAVDRGAHFLFFGPVWDTPEKSGILEPRGLEALAGIAQLGLPVFAIGGISTPDQVTAVRQAGAHGAVVLRAAREAGTMLALRAAADGPL